MLKSLYWRLNFFLKTRKSNRLKQRLGKDVDSIIVNTVNGKFAVDPADLEVGAKLRLTGEYGLDEIKLLSSFLGENASVLILGSHIGSLAIPISKHCENVVSIEAKPNNYKLLQTNVLLNNCSNITTHNIAASDKEETIKFQLNTVNSGGSKRLPIHNKYIYTYDNPEVIEPSSSNRQHKSSNVLYSSEGTTRPEFGREYTYHTESNKGTSYIQKRHSHAVLHVDTYQCM